MNRSTDYFFKISSILYRVFAHFTFLPKLRDLQQNDYVRWISKCLEKSFVPANIMEFTWNGWGIPRVSLCRTEPRFKTRTFEIRSKDADYSTVPFSVSLCCDAIASSRFKTESKFSSVLFIVTSSQFLTTPESVRNRLLKFVCIR